MKKFFCPKHTKLHEFSLKNKIIKNKSLTNYFYFIEIYQNSIKVKNFEIIDK